MKKLMISNIFSCLLFFHCDSHTLIIEDKFGGVYIPIPLIKQRQVSWVPPSTHLHDPDKQQWVCTSQTRWYRDSANTPCHFSCIAKIKGVLKSLQPCIDLNGSLDCQIWKNPIRGGKWP